MCSFQPSHSVERRGIGYFESGAWHDLKCVFKITRLSEKINGKARLQQYSTQHQKALNISRASRYQQEKRTYVSKGKNVGKHMSREYTAEKVQMILRSVNDAKAHL